MGRLVVDGASQSVVLEMGMFEAASCISRRSWPIPLSAITGVEIVAGYERPVNTKTIDELKVGGTTLPWYFSGGTFSSKSGLVFYCYYYAERSRTVVLSLAEGQPARRVIVTVQDPVGIVEQIKEALQSTQKLN